MVGRAKRGGRRPAESDDSDDEAPEEVTLSTGREVAQATRRAEGEGRRRLAQEAKDRRRQQNERAAEQRRESSRAAGPKASGGDVDDEPEPLPASVVAALKSRSRQPEVQVEEADLPKRKRKKREEPRQPVRITKGPVEVRVLGEDTTRCEAAQGAAAFLHEMMNGGGRKR